MIFILIATLLIALYAYYKMSIRALEKFAKNIPGYDGLPIIGNVGEFIKANTLSGIFYKLHEMTDKYSDEGIMKFWFGTKLVTLVWNPEYTEVVANSPHTASKGSIYSFLFSTISTGVVVIDGGPAWKELKKPITKSLTKRLVEEDYLPVMVKRSKDFTDFIEQKREGKHKDVSHDISALTCSIFFDTHFGLKTNEVWERRWDLAQTINNFFLLVNVIVKYHFFLWKIVYRFTSSAALLDGTLDQINKIEQWILDERRKCINEGKELSKGPEYYPDFLLRRAKEKNVPDVEIRKQLTDVIGAGVDTSAVTISSALVFLAMFPEVQDKLHGELADIFQGSDRQPSVEDLKKMSYLEMVIKETLRIIAPPIIGKYCQENLTIGKYTIPKGCYVGLFLNRVHHEPKYWERPHKFYPENLLAENELRRPTFAYLPFGCGPRSCPGVIFASSLMKIIISTILRSFKVTTNRKFEDIVYDYGLMLHLNSYEVKFERKCI